MAKETKAGIRWLLIVFIILGLTVSACKRASTEEKEIASDIQRITEMKPDGKTIFDVEWGLTQDDKGTIYVGLYSLTPQTDGHFRRHFAFACNKETQVPVDFSENAYFVYGKRINDYGYLPVESININGEDIPTRDIKTYREVIEKLNKADNFSYALGNGEIFHMNIKNRSNKPLPCMGNTTEEIKSASEASKP